jgi:hypothetical protein
MGRRRKNDDFEFVELLAKLGGLAVLLIFLAVGPKNFAATVQGLVMLVILGLVLVGVIILAVILIKKKLRARNTDATVLQEFSASPNAVIPRIETPEPEVYTPVRFIEKLRTIDWFQFEKLVALAYELQGYQVSRRGGANPDGGIDLVIEKDGVQTAIQCKQWKTWNVGVKAVREFLGALTDAKLQHGIFITLNGYTGDAKQLAEKHGIEIINETGLTVMLERLNLESDPRVIDLLNDTRKFCPKCEREMILRTAGKGLNAGNQFWGCSGYPKCRFTMQVT